MLLTISTYDRVLASIFVGIDDEGLYRVAGVTSKVQKLTTAYGGDSI